MKPPKRGTPPPPPPEPQSSPEASYDPAHPDARIGVAALSLRYQVGAALAVAVVAVAALVHLGMVFLHVAPSNTVTKQHGKAIDEWIYPEFEQNWKLFAPNPLQQNIEVQVRADVRRHASWGHDLCVRLPAIRSANRGSTGCTDRAAGRTRAGTTEAVRGDGGVVA